MKKQNSLYFFMGTSTFVEKDTSILSNFYNVKIFNFKFGKKWKIPFQIFEQFFFLLKHIPNTKIVFIQLAGFHSLLPILFSKLAGKKSVVIASGTDCHSFPSIGYGNYQRKFLGKATSWSLKNCTMILPKHKSLWQCKYTYDKNDFPEQGIAFFNKGIRTPYICIENGYTGDRFKATTGKLPNSFITVAGLLSRTSQQKLKGIDLIMDVASKFPLFTFTIVGADKSIFPVASENIQFIPNTPNEKLPSILSEHEYYLQLSMAEGFPNALCEAMLCECIPIGSEVFSIPEIISDTGFILKERSVVALEKLLHSLQLNKNEDYGKKARERILTNYTLEKRKLKFREVIDKYLS